MKKSIKSIVVLVCICATVSVLLALTHAVTDPIIKKNEQQSAFAALLEVLPEGGSFESVPFDASTLPTTVSEVFKAENGGYVIKLNTTGYSSGMVLMCGINPDGTVSGTKLIASQETPSIGGAAAETFAPTVIGTDVSTIDGVDTVSGATKTTAAYRGAVKDALNAVIILGGGSVDLRTEEEILRDNLLAALPTADNFTKHFFIEAVEGVDAIYLADNGSGAVAVIGEAFIGADADGIVITACSDEEKAAVEAAMAAIKATTVTDIDLSAYEGLPKQLISAQLTDGGVFIIDIKGVGYGIKGGDEYHPASGEYIVIRVSISAEGKILDCLTLSQAETDGVGSVCADESFYGQFDGKTADNYTEIDAISGATLTTNGYTEAIMRAFNVVNILNGDK